MSGALVNKFVQTYAEQSDASGDTCRKRSCGPCNALGPRKIAGADICADHREHPGAQTERERVEQIFEAHSDAEAGELRRAQGTDETREYGKRQIVEDWLQRHGRAHSQNLDE